MVAKMTPLYWKEPMEPALPPLGFPSYLPFSSSNSVVLTAAPTKEEKRLLANSWIVASIVSSRGFHRRHARMDVMQFFKRSHSALRWHHESAAPLNSAILQSQFMLAVTIQQYLFFYFYFFYTIHFVKPASPLTETGCECPGYSPVSRESNSVEGQVHNCQAWGLSSKTAVQLFTGQFL